MVCRNKMEKKTMVSQKKKKKVNLSCKSKFSHNKYVGQKLAVAFHYNTTCHYPGKKFTFIFFINRDQC